MAIAAPAAGQAFLSPGEVELELESGEVLTVQFELRNALNRSLLGFARLEGAVARGAEPEPPEFRVPPGGTETLGVRIDANAFEKGRFAGRLHLSLVDQETGATQRLHANITADVPAPLLLFGTWSVDLPAAVSGPYGLFLVEVGFWIVGAYVVMKANDLVVRRMLTGTSRQVRSRVLTRVNKPIYFLVAVVGLRFAWRFLPEDGLAGLAGGLLSAVLVLTVAFLIYRAFDSFLVYYNAKVAPKTRTKWDDVVIPVLRKIAIAVLVGFAFFYALQNVGLDLSFLVAGGLIVGFVLSAALGPTLANLFSGLFLMMDRPFVEGDDIRLDSGEVCNVRRVGLRSTRLYYYRNHELIVVPNKDLETGRVTNLMFPDKRYKMHIVVGVAYGSPVERVRDVLFGVTSAHPEVLTDDDSKPMILFDEFGDSALLFRTVVFVTDVKERFRIASELRYAIDAAFRREGVTIPFPQRTVWMQSDDED